jgi:hypothetical protein
LIFFQKIVTTGVSTFMKRIRICSAINTDNGHILPNYSIIATATLLFTLLFSSPRVFATTTQAQHQNRPALSYNCVSNPSTGSGHCYGSEEWGGADGADSRITLDSSLSGAIGGNLFTQGFVNTEMWLTTSDYNYWVEVGVKSEPADNGTNQPFVFWADSRPGGGYSEHWGNYLNSTDYAYGNVLVRITRSGTSNWNVLAQGASTTLTGTSTANNIL